MIATPTPPGQTNQPRPLEYPATRHPQSIALPGNAAIVKTTRTAAPFAPANFFCLAITTPARGATPHLYAPRSILPPRRSPQQEIHTKIRKGTRNGADERS